MIGFLKNQAAKNLLLVLAVLILAAAPLAVYRGAGFEGADGEAEKVITEVRPGYSPWLDSLWRPPGGEVESLLFALQAALGSGFIGYYFGYQRGKKKQRENC